MPPKNASENIPVYPCPRHWQHLFAYTSSQAQIAVTEYLSNPHRLQLSDSQWA
jgi:hypothetical protein